SKANHYPLSPIKSSQNITATHYSSALFDSPVSFS
ncbi:MAG: hypothetical protein ACI8WB_005652, partial [Phenylobacterium sp.]